MGVHTVHATTHQSTDREPATTVGVEGQVLGLVPDIACAERGQSTVNLPINQLINQPATTVLHVTCANSSAMLPSLVAV